MIRCSALVVALGLLPALARGDGQEKKILVKEEFSKKELDKCWSIKGAFAPEEGELRGKGGGWLEYAPDLAGDFTLTFQAWTEEKANVEVTLVDPKSGKPAYTFAFLGLYHSALDGVKSCILKDDAFVNVNPKMWIFPGRMFTFEVRREKSEYQMFLDHELGPFFVDEHPPANADQLRLRLNFSAPGPRDKFRVDNVTIAVPAKK
jgi:hypothetical protein